MIGDKVEMSRKVHGYRYIIETMCRECILGAEDRIEVVGIPIISNKTKDSYPKISFERITLE